MKVKLSDVNKVKRQHNKDPMSDLGDSPKSDIGTNIYDKQNRQKNKIEEKNPGKN